ncbi:MAG: alpha/beta hydrolase [Dehalococcoidia bacterium]
MLDVRSDDRLDGFRQRIYLVAPGGRDVPLALWTPLDVTAPLPLVLIGHGGGGHKQDESRLDLAARYTSRGVAAAAIDGPWHGERALPEGATRPEWSGAVVDSMVADWQATLDALIELPEVDAARIGYGGVSMGTMFGLPFVVGDPRVRGAVLGLYGFRTRDGGIDEVATRIEADAPRLRCPVLFLMQWDDDLFERAGVLEVFDRIGSPEKQLLANPGLHHETPEHARAATTDFLVDHLTAIETG